MTILSTPRSPIVTSADISLFRQVVAMENNLAKGEKKFRKLAKDNDLRMDSVARLNALIAVRIQGNIDSMSSQQKEMLESYRADLKTLNSSGDVLTVIGGILAVIPFIIMIVAVPNMDFTIFPLSINLMLLASLVAGCGFGKLAKYEIKKNTENFNAKWH